VQRMRCWKTATLVPGPNVPEVDGKIVQVELEFECVARCLYPLADLCFVSAFLSSSSTNWVGWVLFNFICDCLVMCCDKCTMYCVLPVCNALFQLHLLHLATAASAPNYQSAH
jgi:hypothetical protein